MKSYYVNFVLSRIGLWKIFCKSYNKVFFRLMVAGG